MRKETTRAFRVGLSFLLTLVALALVGLPLTARAQNITIVRGGSGYFPINTSLNPATAGTQKWLITNIPSGWFLSLFIANTDAVNALTWQPSVATARPDVLTAPLGTGARSTCVVLSAFFAGQGAAAIISASSAARSVGNMNSEFTSCTTPNTNGLLVSIVFAGPSTTAQLFGLTTPGLGLPSGPGIPQLISGFDGTNIQQIKVSAAGEVATTGGSNASVSATGAAVPASATMVGGTDGTNLRAIRITGPARSAVVTADGALQSPLSSESASIVAKLDNAESAFVSGAVTIYGWDGASTRVLRTPNVFKPQNAVACAAEITIWTPAAGKKFRLMGIILADTVAGPILLRDNTAGTIIAIIPSGTGGSGVFVSLGNGILSAAANNVLTATGAAAGTCTGMVFGTEE